MENVSHEPGRPIAVKQLIIDNILRPYYLKTYSVSKTAEITGYHRKTITERRDVWDKRAIAKLKKEFKKGDTRYKVEYLNLNQVLIENALSRLEKIEIDIDNARKNESLNLSQLISNEDQIRRTLQSLNEKRYAVKIEPGAEEVIEIVLEDRIKKHVKSISTN